MINIQKTLKQALAFCNSSQLLEAKNLYLRLLKTIPNNTEVLTNLGTIELQLNNTDEGEKLLRKSLAINPNQPVAICSLGNKFLESGNYEDAIIYYDKAIQINPNDANVFYNEGQAYSKLDNFENAIECYEKAIKLMPSHWLAHNNLGVALKKIRKNEDAIKHFYFATKLNPDFLEAYINCGAVFAELKHYDKAISAYERAIQINPNSAEAYNNCGVVFAELKHYDKAISAYERAIQINPNYPEAHYNKGVLLLSRLHFSQGWHEYSWRFFCEKLNNKYIKSSKSEWDGNSSIKRLFVWAEQGIGDQILYGSMLRDLLALNINITVSIDKKLLPIFRRSFPTINFLSQNEQYQDADYDAHIPLGSLGKFFRRESREFYSHNQNYLIENTALPSIIKSEEQRKKVILCGISWFSSNADIGSDKSISISNLLSLFKLKHLEFINLQYGETTNDISTIKKLTGIDIKSNQDLDIFNDIDGLISTIKTCDIVVTVSNTTAHLAGAIGKETLLLLPFSAAKLWYWTDVDGSSLWYPSVKIFNQKFPGDWSEPIAEIIKYLEQKIESTYSNNSRV